MNSEYCNYDYDKLNAPLDNTVTTTTDDLISPDMFFPHIKMTKLDKDATIPTQGTKYAAGFDLYANESVTIGSGFRALINTGIAIAIPRGMVGLIWPRSGLAVKSGIDVLAGVIDSDYRGDIGVCLFNTNSDKRNGSVYIKKGDRIAQLIIQQYQSFNICEVESLDETERGSGGFGSTGK